MEIYRRLIGPLERAQNRLAGTVRNSLVASIELRSRDILSNSENLARLTNFVNLVKGRILDLERCLPRAGEAPRSVGENRHDVETPSTLGKRAQAYGDGILRAKL